MFFHCKLGTSQCTYFLPELRLSSRFDISFWEPSETTPENLLLDYMYESANISKANRMLSSETGYYPRFVRELELQTPN